jgi:small subunit ribosomal protein S27e
MVRWTEIIPRPKGYFIRVKCSECGNEQIMFSCITMPIHCNVCGGVLAESSGGKAVIKGEVVNTLE